MKVFFVYEPGHVAAFTPKEGDIVVALDREVEYLLAERGVAYVSAKEFRDPNPFERIVFADNYTHGLFGSPQWQAFSYRGVSLGQLFAFPLQEYLGLLLYYTSIFKRVAETYPNAAWVVPLPAGAPPRSGGPLAFKTYAAVMQAAQAVAAELNVVLTLPPQRAVGNSFAVATFSFTRNVLGLLVFAQNALVRLLVRPKKLQLVISDYWRYSAPYIKDLPDAGVTMLDRSELKNIPWSQVIKHRMQFVRFVGSDTSSALQLAAKQLQTDWGGNRKTFAPVIYDGVAVTEAVVEALDHLAAEPLLQVLRQIDGAYRLLAAKPTAVLLRASVSGQTHFGVLAQVAKLLNVPAIEVQHGLEYLGPGSSSREHAAQYVALYGPAIGRELLQLGFEQSRLLPIGSPRFDVYEDYKSNKNGSVVCIGPDIYVGGLADSYDCEEYLAKFFTALPSDAKSVVKLRGGMREAFFRKMIARVQGTHNVVIETRPLPVVFKNARTVVSCYSTAILESLQCGIPTVLLPLSKIDLAIGQFHFTQYKNAGVLSIAKDKSELAAALEALKDVAAYDSLSRNIRGFMAREYCFDGKASKRVAAFIKGLVQ